VSEFLLDIVGYPYLGKKKKKNYEVQFKKNNIKGSNWKKNWETKKKIGAKSLSCNSVPNVWRKKGAQHLSCVQIWCPQLQLF
jgi:hypothetical protein